MRINRKKNATRNIIWGFLQRIVILLLTFVNRTIIIYHLGDNYVGLGSLFSSILSVLNLAELGFGTALVYSMYEPIAKDNTIAICALMKYYKKCYRIIGLIVLIAGLAFLPFIPQVIKGSYPSDIDLFVLYIMYLAETVLSYFLFAYKNCLFDAHQRKDIAAKVSIVVKTLSMLLQLMILLVYKNYYLYIGIGLVATLMINCCVSILARKYYPNYKCAGEIEKETKKKIANKIRGLMTSKIGGVVINSADNIVISAFLGLSVLGWYNNYYYIMDAIIIFLNIILHSLTAGIGNKIVTENIESNYSLFKNLNFTYQWIVTWCATCLLCLYQPIMSLWHPKGMLPFSIVCLMVFRFFAGRTVQMTFTYKDALGLWWEDRWRPIVASIVNLTINIILVNLIGIAGVIISTFISTIFINTPWGNNILFKHYFRTGIKEYYKSLLCNYIVSLVVCTITYCLCVLVSEENFTGIIIRLTICCVIPNVLLAMIYHNKKEYRQYFRRLVRMSK